MNSRESLCPFGHGFGNKFLELLARDPHRDRQGKGDRSDGDVWLQYHDEPKLAGHERHGPWNCWPDVACSVRFKTPAGRLEKDKGGACWARIFEKETQESCEVVLDGDHRYRARMALVARRVASIG